MTQTKQLEEVRFLDRIILHGSIPPTKHDVNYFFKFFIILMIVFLRGYTVTESSVYLNPILQETNLMVQNGILEKVTDLLITVVEPKSIFLGSVPSWLFYRRKLCQHVKLLFFVSNKIHKKKHSW
jgi:hypothetical protein